MRKEDVKVGISVRINKKDVSSYGKIFTVESFNRDCAVLDNPICENWTFDYLDPVDELECLEEGQILYSKNENYYIKILARLGGKGELTTYAVSQPDNEENSNRLKIGGELWTTFEFKKYGYKPYRPEAEEVMEVTMSEVCEKFGKNVKIKKE